MIKKKHVFRGFFESLFEDKKLIRKDRTLTVEFDLMKIFIRNFEITFHQKNLKLKKNIFH